MNKTFYKIRLMQTSGLEFYSTRIYDKVEALKRYQKMVDFPAAIMGAQFCHMELIEFIDSDGYEHHNGVIAHTNL